MAAAGSDVPPRIGLSHSRGLSLSVGLEDTENRVFLVTGGLGNVGRGVLESLADPGQGLTRGSDEIRCLTRNPQSTAAVKLSKDLRSVAVVKGDFEDPLTL